MSYVILVLVVHLATLMLGVSTLVQGTNSEVCPTLCAGYTKGLVLEGGRQICEYFMDPPSQSVLDVGCEYSSLSLCSQIAETYHGESCVDGCQKSDACPAWSQVNFTVSDLCHTQAGCGGSIGCETLLAGWDTGRPNACLQYTPILGVCGISGGLSICNQSLSQCSGMASTTDFAVCASEGCKKLCPTGTPISNTTDQDVCFRDGEQHDCGLGLGCSSEGECLKTLGQTCSSASQCLSGNCVDGHCCNTACNQACKSCSSGTCQDISSACGAGGCTNQFRCVSGSCIIDPACLPPVGPDPIASAPETAPPPKAAPAGPAPITTQAPVGPVPVAPTVITPGPISQPIAAPVAPQPQAPPVTALVKSPQPIPCRGSAPIATAKCDTDTGKWVYTYATPAPAEVGNTTSASLSMEPDIVIEPGQVVVIAIGTNVTLDSTIAASIGSFGAAGLIEFEGDGCISLSGMVQIQIGNDSTIHSGDRAHLIRAPCLTDDGVILQTTGTQSQPCTITTAEKGSDNTNFFVLFDVQNDPGCADSIMDDSNAISSGVIGGSVAGAVVAVVAAVGVALIIKKRRANHHSKQMAAMREQMMQTGDAELHGATASNTSSAAAMQPTKIEQPTQQYNADVLSAHPEPAYTGESYFVFDEPPAQSNV